VAVDLAKLVVSLEAETGRLQTQLDAARSKLDRFQRGASTTSIAVGNLLARGIEAAASRLTEMAFNAVNTADEISKMARAVGASTEFISESAYAASLAGVEFEAYTAALVKLSKNAVMAQRGSKEQADAFRALGVDAGEVARDVEGGIDLIADAFARFSDGPEKAAVAVALFGKTAGPNMVSLLNAGSVGLRRAREEARSFGVTLSSEAAQAAEQFNDNLSRMGFATQGLVNRIVQGLLPTVANISDAWVGYAKNASVAEGITRGIQVVLETVTVLGAETAFVITSIGREIGGLAAQAAAIAQGQFAQAREIRRLMVEDAEAARKAQDAFVSRVLDRTAPAASATPAGAADAAGKLALGYSALGTAVNSAQSDLQRLVSHLKEQEATLGMTAGQIEVYRLRAAGAKGETLEWALGVLNLVEVEKQHQALLESGRQLTEAMRTPIEELASAQARYDELLDAGVISYETYARAVLAAQEAFDAATGAQDAAAESIQRLNSILSQTPTAQLEQAARDIELLWDAYQRGQLGVVGSLEAVRQYSEGVSVVMSRVTADVETSSDQWETVAKRAAENMQDAFADFLFDPFDKGLKGMLQSFQQTIQRMVAEAVARDIFKALMGSMGSVGGVLGGVFKGLFGGSFAAGGDLPAGKVSLVGERGPELVLPSRSRAILSNSDTRRALAGGGSNVAVTVNVSGVQDEGTLRRSSTQVAAAVTRAVSKGRRNL